MDYEQADLELLEEQESGLCFPKFHSADALALGNELVHIACDYDREIGVRIVRESDEMVIFQYIMDGKDSRNIQYMESKRAAAKRCGHNSFWAYVDHELHGNWQEMFDDVPAYLPCAGAYPIKVSGEWIATLMVSGLHNGQDHELMIRALSNYLKTDVPVFRKTIV